MESSPFSSAIYISMQLDNDNLYNLSIDTIEI